MGDIHYYETTEERRKRLGGGTSHGQALCGNGSATEMTRIISEVTCKVCLRKLGKHNG